MFFKVRFSRLLFQRLLTQNKDHHFLHVTGPFYQRTALSTSSRTIDSRNLPRFASMIHWLDLCVPCSLLLYLVSGPKYAYGTCLEVRDLLVSAPSPLHPHQHFLPIYWLTLYLTRNEGDIHLASPHFSQYVWFPGSSHRENRPETTREFWPPHKCWCLSYSLKIRRIWCLIVKTFFCA